LLLAVDSVLQQDSFTVLLVERVVLADDSSLPHPTKEADHQQGE
jgi:hypothetical protein